MSIDDIKTKSMERKEQKRIKEIARKLEEVLKLPQLKGLIKPVVIWSYKEGGSSYHYGNLYLTNGGLREESGYNDGIGGDESYLSCSGKNKPRMIKPNDFKRIIEKYDITSDSVEYLRNRLEDKL